MAAVAISKLRVVEPLACSPPVPAGGGETSPHVGDGRPVTSGTDWLAQRHAGVERVSIHDVTHIRDFQLGEILVTEPCQLQSPRLELVAGDSWLSDQDWAPIMKEPAGIVTNR